MSCCASSSSCAHGGCHHPLEQLATVHSKSTSDLCCLLAFSITNHYNHAANKKIVMKNLLNYLFYRQCKTDTRLNNIYFWYRWIQCNEIHCMYYLMCWYVSMKGTQWDKQGLLDDLLKLYHKTNQSISIPANYCETCWPQVFPKRNSWTSSYSRL